MNFAKYKNKLIALAMTVVMLLSCFGTMASADEVITDYWSGETAAPEEGSGTLADPYLIENPEQFAYMLLEANGGDNWDKNAVYSLTTDIYLNDVTKIDWYSGAVQEGYVPNLWKPEHFSGIIQGNGHMVYGLYIDSAPESYTENFSSGAALIATNWLNKWVQINDLGMDCVYVNSPHVSGAFFGSINQGNSGRVDIGLNGCYLGSSVTVKGFAAGGLIGGGNGSKANVRIKNCASLTTGFFDCDENGKARNKSGAMIGDVWSCFDEEIDNCYALTKIYGNSTPGYKDGEKIGGSVTNDYSCTSQTDVTVVKVANMQGLDVLVNEIKMPGLGGGFTPTETFPLPTAIYNHLNNQKTESKIKIWNGKTSAPTKGSGTTTDPYLIETAEEFAYMMLEVNGGDSYDRGATYKLMNDIYLNDINKINWKTGKPVDGYTPNAWTPEHFSGIIYGNGHTVYGLYIERAPETYTEKWGGGTGAALITENWANKWIQINDMGMDCVYVNSPNVSAVFVAGSNGNDTTQISFNGCYIGSTVTVKGFAAGGFFGGGAGGSIYVKAKNCMSLATNFYDNGRNRYGAVLGDVWGPGNETIDNCYALIKVYGNNEPGGSLTNNYSAVDNKNVTKLDTANMQGKDVLKSKEKMPNLGAGFVATEGYPYPAAFYGTLIEETIITEEVWDGTTIPAVKGDGSENSPFEIATAEQFAYAISVGSGNYKLTADIYLNDIDKIDWETGLPAEGYEPNTWYRNQAFSGTIDGNGHVVYGLYINSADEKAWGFEGAGLIPKVAAGKTAILKNIGIENAYINAPQAVGGLFGSNQTGVAVAEQCYVGEKVTLCGYETGAFMGLDTGEFHFNNCYSLAKTVRGIESDYACDIGLLGEFYVWPEGDMSIAKSSVTNCYNGYSGGSTKGAPGKVQNVFTAVSAGFGTRLSSAEMQGTVMTTNKMVLSNAFLATDTYPILRVFTDFDEDYWNGLAHSFVNGDGQSAKTAYEISTAGQLAYAVATNGQGLYYKLAKDIYLNDITKVNWTNGTVKEGTTYTPVKWFTSSNAVGTSYNNALGQDGQFCGVVDGCGHTVYGVLNGNDGVATIGGLFPAAVDTHIKNLRVSNSYIAAGRFGGTIVGYFKGTLENVIVTDSVSIYGYESADHESSAIGGLVGYANYAELKNCAFTGKITATSAVNHVYSLIGTSWGNIVKAENCFGVGRQPYTVSHGMKQFDTEQAAKAYFDGLYAAVNVYTDTKANDNLVAFTYGAGKTKGTYSPFSFTMVENADMKGENALTAMAKLDDNHWKSTKGYPVLKLFDVAFGDVDGDNIPATEKDVIIVREAIISDNTSADTDVACDGKTNICDLVKLMIAEPVCVSGETEYTYVKWEGVDKKTIYYTVGNSESESAAKQLFDAAVRRGDDPLVRGGISYKGNQISFYVDKTMSPAEYTTTLVGSNVIVTAGSGNALMKASEKIGELYTEDYIPLVCGVCDYDESVTLSSGATYTYVWGDEFYGTALDRNKWVNTTSNSKMSGFKDILLLDTEESVFVRDGKLTLRAMEYTDPNNPNIKYGVPASVHSQGKMEFRYGYAEIYAKVPFKKGVWPSFWATGDTRLGGRKNFDYMVEVDVFEIFGSVNEAVPNIHKWYQNYDYNTNHNQSTDTAKGHTQFTGSKRTYKFANYENLSNEYHLYGVEWTPTEISVYVDGTKYMTFDITKSYDKYEDMTGFHDPLLIIFNNHVFSPESSYKPNEITGLEKQNLPADYEIDWIRVYQNKAVEGSEIYRS